MAASIDFQENGPESFSYNNTDVYLLDDLILFDRAFFYGCVSKPRLVIQKKNLPPDSYFIARKRVLKGQTHWIECDLTVKQGKILITKWWAHQNIPKFSGDTSVYKYKPLPALLELEESEKFKDDEGNVYEVEVRGERNEEMIRFKGKDIARVFEMENLIHDIQKIHTCYIEKEDYEIYSFETDGTMSHQTRTNERGNQTDLFLTYQGLLKVIFNSRSGIAHRFRQWATRIIFTAHLGTQEQRTDLALDLVGVNAQMVKDVISTCVTQMPCIYFFIIGKMVDLRKKEPVFKKYMKGYLCKYGLTDNLKRRTGEHQVDYGMIENSLLKLKYFSPIDVKYISKAETYVKNYFLGKNQHVEYREHIELVYLDNSDVVKLKKVFLELYEKYSSEVQELVNKNLKLTEKMEDKEKYIQSLDLVIKAKDDIVKRINKENEGLKMIIQEQQILIKGYQEREQEYRKDKLQKDELMKDISNKLAKYSKMLAENPTDPTIHEKIRKYRIKVMKLAGATEEDLTKQMTNMRL